MTDGSKSQLQTERNPLEAEIRAQIEASSGRMTLARFMELALYHPAFGYYFQPERRPGRTGDFLTSPEASPLFGLTLARQMAECWKRLGHPSAWTIREYGSGIGGLAYDILVGLSEECPEAFEAVRYEMVELNPSLRAETMRSMSEVGLIDRIAALAPVDASASFRGVMLANEVADAMPAHRLVVHNGKLRERYVVNSESGFKWIDGEVSPAATEYSEALKNQLPELPNSAILDVSPAASTWFQEALATIEQGFAIVIDYGYEAKTLFSRHRLLGTVRAYREHRVTDDPLQMPGQQDLTVHVDFTRLIEAGETMGWTVSGLTTQGAFLASLGLGDYLVGLQSDASASAEDYYAAQAVIMRLIDPGGLGRFGVLIMDRNIDNSVPLSGFKVKPPSF